MGSLEEAFARSAVMDMAGPAVYWRGTEYFDEGRVEPDERLGDRLRARVHGSVPYTVELRVERGHAGWSCTCPYAEDGSFCKHVVAVSLLLAGRVPEPPPTPAEARASARERDRLLAEHVGGMNRERLVELVLASAEQDWRLRERLLAEARAGRGEAPDLAVWRDRIDAAFSPYDDFVTYQEAAGWAAEVEEIIDALTELCDAGHPDAVVTLAEQAHRRADGAIGYVDDSDGWLSTISHRLTELHHRACVEGAPDPADLARRLVDLELTSELDGFHRAAQTYAHVLGADGLAAYREVVESRWRDLRSRSGDRSERYTLREAMAGLAVAAEDPDQLIEVYRDDLQSSRVFVEIASLLDRAGRPDEAETWARTGLEVLAGMPWQTSGLDDLLAALLRGRGDTSAAVEVYWDAFERAPSLAAYRRLVTEAGDDADTVKERALAALRRRVGKNASVLIEVLAHEGEVEAAWRVAEEHGCDQRLWMALARGREASHPLDAIDVYEREVRALIDAKKNHTYRHAVDLLRRIRRLATEAGRTDRSTELVAAVRAEHSRKRNLMKLMDQHEW